MRQTVLVAIGLASLVSVAGFAESHEKPYTGFRVREVGEGGTVFGQGGETGDDAAGVDCGIGNHTILNLSWGAVCFGADPEHGWGNGHEGFTDAFGNPAGAAETSHIAWSTSAFLDINDSRFPLVPGTYCQDLWHDGLCGGNANGQPETEVGGNPHVYCQMVHREGTMGCSMRSEPAVHFCDSITIQGGLGGPLSQGTRLVAGVYPGVAGTGDWADPFVSNWNQDEAVFVFIHGPNSGNPPAPNLFDTDSYGTQGGVSHSP